MEDFIIEDKPKQMRHKELSIHGIGTWHYYRITRTKDYNEYREKYMKAKT